MQRTRSAIRIASRFASSLASQTLSSLPRESLASETSLLARWMTPPIKGTDSPAFRRRQKAQRHPNRRARTLQTATQPKFFSPESGPIVPNRLIRARDTKRVASGGGGCGDSVRDRRQWLNRARNPSSSIRYVADSSHGIRIDFESSFNLESCSCPRCPTRPRAQQRISPTSVPFDSIEVGINNLMHP